MEKNYLLSAVSIVACAGCDIGSVNEGGDTSDAGPVVDGGAPSTPVFRPTIQSDLSNAGCLTAFCHGGGTMPMQLVTPPSDESEWLANYQQVSTRIDTLIAKSTGGGGHTASLSEGDPIPLRWQAWIDGGAPYEATAAPDAGSPVDAGSLADAPAGGLTWNSSIRQMLIGDGCTGCHGLQGAYSLETYSGALGFGADQITPNVIPGDATSLLIVYYDDEHYTTSTENAALVRQWIVEADAEE